MGVDGRPACWRLNTAGVGAMLSPETESLPTHSCSTRGHEFLTCGIRAGDTDKLKTCRHGGQHIPCRTGQLPSLFIELFRGEAGAAVEDPRLALGDAGDRLPPRRVGPGGPRAEVGLAATGPLVVLGDLVGREGEVVEG